MDLVEDFAVLDFFWAYRVGSRTVQPAINAIMTSLLCRESLRVIVFFLKKNAIRNFDSVHNTRCMLWLKMISAQPRKTKMIQK
jgi:hypothetical protein